MNEIDIRVLIYDLETQMIAQELPTGWEDAESLRVSILGYTRLHWENGNAKAFYTDILRENEMSDFFQSAANSEAIVGWGAFYYNQVLSIYDEGHVMRNKPIIDLKHLTGIHSNDTTIQLGSIAEALGVQKMGKNGLEAIEYFRRGHFYELSRFVLWDVNILILYWIKIMSAIKEGSSILVLNGEKKQVRVNLYEIRKDIDKIISKRTAFLK